MAKDVFPQFEVATLTIAVANTHVIVDVDFPNDLVQGEVLELTKLVLYTPGVEQPDAATVLRWWVDVSTRTGVLTFPDPDLIWRMSEAIFNTHAATNEGTSIGPVKHVISEDLTDGQGRGVLVPADKLYVLLDTANYSGTPEFILRIYYRIVKVSATEVLEFLTSG